MLKFKIVILVFAVSFLAQPCFADSGVPDLYMSEAFIAYDGPGIPSLMVVPDGTVISTVAVTLPSGVMSPETLADISVMTSATRAMSRSLIGVPADTVTTCACVTYPAAMKAKL